MTARLVPWFKDVTLLPNTASAVLACGQEYVEVNPSILRLFLTEFQQVSCIATLLCWIVLYCGLSRHGFIIRRRLLSTDSVIGNSIGITSLLWTAVAIYTGTNERFKSSPEGYVSDSIQSLISSLAQAPFAVVLLFSAWLLMQFDMVALQKNGSLTAWKVFEMPNPYDWQRGLREPWCFLIRMAIPILTGFCAVFSIFFGDSLLGVLNMAGVLLLVTRSVSQHPFNSSAHRYAADELRIILPTTHHEGTVYILPSQNRGFDAVWSPKIENEHAQADRYMMALFSKMRSGTANPADVLESIRATVAGFHARLSMSIGELECIADWIYPDQAKEAYAGSITRRIECQRAPGVHLIGRDLIFALCHAEYIVFMGHSRLSKGTQSKLSRLRFMRRSGAGSGTDNAQISDQTIGLKPGFEGYAEAIRHVYAIFHLPVDELALNFSSATAPAHSRTLGIAPASIDDYVFKLWDFSVQHSESTFTALYFFNVVWFMEVGNVNGFHIFPLRVKSRDGDVVDFGIIWRQIWWEACISQLPMVSLTMWDTLQSGCLR